MAQPLWGGCTLHNGCVIAANAVITKDVPPYAIVGGNPAKIIKYRFDKHTISGLQKIAWWNWPKERQIERKNDFSLPVQLFVEKYIQEAEEKFNSIRYIEDLPLKTVKILLIPDLNHEYPLYPKILKQFFEKDRPNVELLIYLPEEDSKDNHFYKIENILKKYETRDSYITLQTGITLNEHILFQCSDYYITTRDKQTVNRTCLADIYNVKILYGTDEPIFPENL